MEHVRCQLDQAILTPDQLLPESKIPVENPDIWEG
jgi:hypothetical protein